MNASRCGATLGLLLLLVSTVGLRPVAAQEVFASLTVWAHVCPSGYVGPDFWEACESPDAIRSIRLDGPIVSEWTTDESGSVLFPRIPAGQYRVTLSREQIFLLDAVIVCSAPGWSDQAGFVTKVGANAVEIVLDPGDEIVCDWFFLVTAFPRQGTPGPFSDAAAPWEVPILAVACDADPGPVSIAAETLPDGCTAIEGASFVVSTEDGESLGTCITGPSGECRFPGIRDVPILVAEMVSTLPTGYLPRRNPMPTIANAASGFVAVNLPKELVGATISLRAAICPEGFTGPGYFETCFDTPGPDYRFTVNQPGRLSTISSFIPADSEGRVFFTLNGVQPGTLSIWGAGPSGLEEYYPVDSPVVFCTRPDRSVVDVSNPDPAADGTYREIEITAGDEIRCDWYFVPRRL